MKSKSLKVNAIMSGLKTLFSMLFPLITFPYASRVLGVYNLGRVNFSNSIISYFVLIAGLGILSYAIREGAAVRDDREKLNNFANQVFTINIITSLISYILLLCTILSSKKITGYSEIIAIQSLTIIGTTIGIDWLYSVYEDYTYITIRSLIFQILSLILLFLMVRSSQDYLKYASITVISNIGSNMFNYIHSRKYIKLKLTYKGLTQHLKPVFILFASSVATTLYVNSDITMIGFFCGDYNVGIYSVATKVYFIIKSLIGATILISLPRLSNLLATKRKDKYNRLLIDIYKTLFLILLPVVTGMLVIAPEVVRLVAGKSYLEATSSLRILCFSLIFSVFGIYFTNAILLPMKKEKVVLIATVIGAVVNVLLNLVLIPLLKQDGASITTLIAEVIVFIVQYLAVRKRVELKVERKFLLGIVLGCISIASVSMPMGALKEGLLIRIFLTIFSSIICYFVVLVVTKNEVMFKYMTMIKKQFGT